MSQNVVFNGSEVALEVDVERGAEKTSVFIQPKGRATLEEDFQVTPLFLKLNTLVRQVPRSEYEAQKAMLTSRASYFPTATAKPTSYSASSSDSSASGSKSNK